MVLLVISFRASQRVEKGGEGENGVGVPLFSMHYPMNEWNHELGRSKPSEPSTPRTPRGFQVVVVVCEIILDRERAETAVCVIHYPA